jgi:F0F1-type ATP synthase epsilon subunit
MAPKTALTVFLADPNEQIFSGKAQKVTLWTGEGQITILPHHAPYAAPLLPGRPILLVQQDGGQQRFIVGEEGGVVCVRNNMLHILLG